MFQKLLVATDGSELGTKALDKAIELARLSGGSIIVLTATDPVATGIGAGGFGTINAGSIVSRLEDAYAEGAKPLLDQARAKVEAAGIDATTLHVPRQSGADAIIATAADRDVDLIIMGSHGRRGIGRLLLGSQAAEVLAHSKVPVLIVK